MIVTHMCMVANHHPQRTHVQLEAMDNLRVERNVRIVWQGIFRAVKEQPVMKYRKIIILKNGMECCLRNATESDGQPVLDNFKLTHTETDYLLTYPDESAFDAAQESRILKEKENSENEVEIIAIVDGAVIGTAGIEAVGTKYKVRHRAEFGISVLKKFWGLGIGRALMVSCIECAKAAGYSQLELSVVAENVRAFSMYKKVGFIEYGRNPKGFHSRKTGFQEVIYMRLEL